MSVPCPVCASPTTDGTVCLHCGSISPAPAFVAVPVEGGPLTVDAGALTPVVVGGPLAASVPPVVAAVGVPAVPMGAVPMAAVPPDDASVFGGPAAVSGPAVPGSAVPVSAVPVSAVPAPAVPGAVPVAAVPGVGPTGEPVAVPVAVAPGPVPVAAPMGALVLASPPPRSTVGRAIVLGVAAAVILSAAWVGGYLYFDRSEEVGRPVIAAQSVGDPTAGAGPTDLTDLTDPTDLTYPTDLTGPTDGVDPTAPLEFDDQGFQSPAESLPSTPPTVPIAPVPVAGQATCEAPPGVDAAGAPQTYEVGRAFDGVLDTAWRCSGDASGQSITVDLGQPVLLTSVGLVPGYDKIDPVDGADRFAQGRTVVRARWTFDDGSSIEVTPDGARGMQLTPVQVTTQTARLEILETRPGATITDNAGVQWAAVDATAVSEVQFAGLTY